MNMQHQVSKCMITVRDSHVQCDDLSIRAEEHSPIALLSQSYEPEPEPRLSSMRLLTPTLLVSMHLCCQHMQYMS